MAQARRFGCVVERQESSSQAGPPLFSRVGAHRRDVAGQDVLRDLGEWHGRFDPALALDPPEPQAGRDIPDIEGDNLRTAEPPEAHELRVFSRTSVHCSNTDSTVSHRGTRGSRALRRGRVNPSTGFRATCPPPPPTFPGYPALPAA